MGAFGRLLLGRFYLKWFTVRHHVAKIQLSLGQIRPQASRSSDVKGGQDSAVDRFAAAAYHVEFQTINIKANADSATRRMPDRLPFLIQKPQCQFARIFDYSSSQLTRSQFGRHRCFKVLSRTEVPSGICCLQSGSFARSADKHSRESTQRTVPGPVFKQRRAVPIDLPQFHS